MAMKNSPTASKLDHYQGPTSPTLSINQNEFKQPYTLPPEEQQVTSGNEMDAEDEAPKLERKDTHTSNVPDL